MAKQANAGEKQRRRRFTRDDAQLFLLSLPTTIWYALFCYLPMFGLVIAFKKYRAAPGKGFLWNLFHNSAWCGLDNFRFLFSNNANTTWIMFRNTLGYNIVFLILSIVIPVSLAIMIGRLRHRRLARAAQTAMFFPHFLSWVVVGYFVYAFLATDKGIVDRLLKHFGAEPVRWYQEEAVGWWPWILIFLYVWKSAGYNMVVYLAAIRGIDDALYEAALMDGASLWQQTRYITLPLLKPMVTIMFLMALGKLFNSDFGLFYRTTRNSGSLIEAYLTLDVYVYNAIFNSSRPVFGYISAAGFLQSVLGCMTILAANAVVRKLDSENALF